MALFHLAILTSSLEDCLEVLYPATLKLPCDARVLSNLQRNLSPQKSVIPHNRSMQEMILAGKREQAYSWVDHVRIGEVYFEMEQFMNPGAEYRIQPFWFWNGDMNNEEIERQIEEMYEQGVGGFFICPRQGLQIPYLSDTWFEKVRFAIEAAKNRGMHVWLYDEYPYPSGIAGGEVTLLHPDAKHQTLVTTEKRVSGGSKVRQEYPWAKVIYAKAVPVTEDGERQWGQMVNLKNRIGNLQADPIFQKTGLTTYNQKRFFTYRTIFQLDWEAPASAYEWDIIVYQEKEIEDFKYYGTFVDPCHKEAMQTFINLTHERYARHIGSEFGDTVKGMFTDEIGLLGSMPWTPRLEAYFKERHG
jgi:hypothetical protein